MPVSYFLVLSAFLFSVGVYGVLARRNAVLVLLSIELMLNAVNVNLVAFSAALGDGGVPGQVFALFIIAVAAAEVGVGLAVVLLIYRNMRTVDVDRMSLMKW
jgi:NADH:ubiquinone oxidoreductase subunit K